MPESPGSFRVTKKQAEVWLKRFADEKLRELFESTGTPRTVAEIVEELRFSGTSDSWLPQSLAR